MKIASWNVNSLKVRLPHLEEWLKTAAPDVIALQETKLEDGAFPHAALEAAGYHCAFTGQKAYNGVALLAREPLCEVLSDATALDDPARRIIAATIGGIRIVNLYVVNGQEVGSEKYAHKLRWMDAVRDILAAELTRYPELVVVGDFNVAPEDRDVHDPKRWREKILCSTPEREALQRMFAMPLHDSFRLFEQGAGHHSWWDYRLMAFRRNWGLRIDLVLVSEALRNRCRAVGIDRATRAWDRPSDHVPVWVEIT